ncbi:MAG: type II secretion system F family protein [Rhodocyclaceae bacterium]|nr:type II secretion system F family protein [Rhodocyclaceae bacterium]MDZ4215104.1 type II secretion system F family protein [Rhodocyclaceae bacterium]
MEVFDYKGRTKRGEIMTGTIESPSQDAVAEWLLTSGIAPIAITLQQSDSGDPAWLRKLKETGTLTLRDLLLFTRQMYTMVKAGVPLIQALAGIQKSTTNPVMIKIMRTVRADLEKGVVLSTAMSRHPKVFDEYYVSMVRVGEDAGQLEEIFKRLFDQLEFENHMKKKIKSALRYPTFVVTAIAIAIGILTVFVIPVFATFFAKFGSQLPLMTRILLGTSEFAVTYWWIVLMAIAGAIFSFKLYTGKGAGRYQWDRYKLRLPIAGGILQKATLSRFCRSLSTASRSGVPLVQAFTLVSRVVDNAFYEERILQMRSGVERGESMLSVAQAAGIFTPLELQMISVGEDTGDIDGMLGQVADIYQEEVEYEIGRLSETMEPILMSFMGVLVLILLLGIFMPMWQLGAAVKGQVK